MNEIIGIDHIYLAVSDLARAERFHDSALRDILGFRKQAFALNDTPHIQYYNRHFGIVLRPAETAAAHGVAPGLHHLCLRVDSIEDVQAIAQKLQAAGLAATPASHYPQYAPDYWASFFNDPDGIRFEVTNYRAERRERFECWDAL